MKLLSREDAQEALGLSRYELEWYQAQGFFGLKNGQSMDSRWLDVWNDHTGYLSAGFTRMEALARSTDHVFGVGAYEALVTDMALYG